MIGSNVSQSHCVIHPTRQVYGLSAFLYFKPAGNSIIFSLPLTASRRLRNAPLLPEAEIELTVSQVI